MHCLIGRGVVRIAVAQSEASASLASSELADLDYQVLVLLHHIVRIGLSLFPPSAGIVRTTAIMVL